MAKQRVNKNLVASITVAGIALAVIVVAIAAFNASRRNPEETALKAKAQEEAGEPRRAIALYQKAFRESKETSKAEYLLEAARVARKMGDLNTMFGLLNGAYAQSPDNSAVLNALLLRYWEIRDFFMGQWPDVRERATKLCSKEPDNLLALASLAEALEWLSNEDVTRDDRIALAEALEWLNVDDATFPDLADQILAHAAAIDPTSSHVALVRAKQSLLRAGQQLRQALQQERGSDTDEIVQQASVERVGYLRPALEAHPDDVALRVACAQALADSKQWAASRALLETGIERQADHPDLHYELARVYLQEIRQRIRDAVREAQDQSEAASPEDVRARAEDVTRAAIDQTLVTEGMRHAERAIELEPALYRAYVRRADFQQLGWIGDASWMEDLPGHQKTILESYAAALHDTVGLESFRAVLAGFRLERLELISAAFDTAQSFHRGSTDEQVRSQALTYLRRFLQEAQTQFPGRARTLLMEGYVALIDGDRRIAVRTFGQAEEQGEQAGGPALAFARLAREELSRLYRTLGELGLSLEYTKQAIEDYRRLQETPPGWLYLQQVSVLLALDRAQEALDLVESIADLFPDWPPLKTARARALTALERREEAMQEMQALPSDDPRYLFEQGRIAILNEDYDTAATLFGKILEADPEHIAAIDRLLRVLIAAERNDEAQQFVRERLETTTNEQLRRLLQSFDLVLSESDPEVRKQKRLEMIAAIPDEYERAEEFFHFWRLQGQLKQALPYLDQMERLREGDLHVLRLQFEMALRLEDCERAERYTTALAHANVDQVGGAMFRGRYELRCGEASAALTEFRAAERVFPRDSELKTHLARTLMRLTPPRYTQAIQALQEAVEYDPRSFDAQKLLYACYEATGRRDEGIPHLAVAAEVAKRLRIKDEYVEAHAQLLDEEKDPRQGIENRERICDESPQDVANLLRLAELYRKVGDSELAQERLQAAAQADPGNSMVARFAANFFAQRDDRAAGEELLRQHLEAQEGLGEIVARALLGRFYEMLADRQLVRMREMVSAGETAETAIGPQREILRELYQLALQAYQQAQERAPDALAGRPEEERQRAIIASASELADFHRRTKRWEEMIDAYRVILSHLDPDQTASIQLARLRIISGLQSLRRYGEARDELERYRQDFPGNLNGMMAAAEFLMARGDPDGLIEARELLSRVLAENPDSAWSLYMRGLVNVQQQRYPAARDDLSRAKKVAPQAFNLKHRFDLAKLHELMDKPRLAEAELRELLEVERRGDRDVELQLISFLERTKQLDKALEFVNQLIARDPQQPFWPYELGMLLMERGEYSAAVPPLRKSVELTNYENTKAIEDMLQAMVRGNRAGEAIREYEGLLPKLVERRLEPARILTPLIKTYAAEAYFAENRREITVSLLEQAINEASLRGVPTVRDVTGRARLLLGREDGLALLRSVLEHASEPMAELAMRITLADVLATGGESAEQSEALEIIEAVLSQLTEGSRLHFEALHVQALALNQTGRTEEAVAVYEQALQLVPNDLRTLNNLTYLLADELERAAEALPYARQLHELAPALEPRSRPAAYDTVGWALFKAGNNEQAVPVFLEALRIEPDYLAARYHLGLVYADSGRGVPAEKEFRELLLRIREQMAEAKSDEQRLKLEEYQNKAEEALEKLR